MTIRKIIAVAASLMLATSTFAQQALWGGPQLVSPEVNPDNTVTFRFAAPKAIKVQVTGDFLPTKKIQTPFGEFDGPGVADLKEGKSLLPMCSRLNFTVIHLSWMDFR